MYIQTDDRMTIKTIILIKITLMPVIDVYVVIIPYMYNDPHF